MKTCRFEINRSGVRALLKSSEIMKALDEHAATVEARAGRGYERSKYTGRNRANVAVVATSPKALKDNAKHNTLLKALKAGTKGD